MRLIVQIQFWSFAISRAERDSSSGVVQLVVRNASPVLELGNLAQSRIPGFYSISETLVSRWYETWQVAEALNMTRFSISGTSVRNETSFQQSQLEQPEMLYLKYIKLKYFLSIFK